jgi:phage recombination protein Bet
MSEVQKDKFLVQFKVGDEDVKLSPAIVRDYLTNGVEVSLPEFKMFAELCKARKLNPFLKEAYIIKFGNQPATIVVGKDAILKRAINNKNFNGREQGIIVLDKNGEVQHRKGTFKLSDDVLVGGWAKVHRKDWEYPTEITVSFDEVAQTKRDGTMNSNWATKGATMVEKVALVRALREAFAEDLGGMIDEDEAWTDPAHRESKKQPMQQSDPMETVDAEIVTEISLDDIA